MFVQTARLLRAGADALEAFGARRHLKDAPEGVEASYDFIESFTFGRVRLAPLQIREEMVEFLRRLAIDPPRSILELGTARGGTLFLFTRIAARDATIVTIDLPGARFGGGYPRAHAPLLKAFGRDRQTISLVRGDSHSPATFERVRRLFSEGVDLLFIDADHTYEGVRSDYEMYSPLVKPGGLIAFHDIVEGRRERIGDVPRFWAEIRNGSEEIVADRSQSGFGIGLMVQSRDSDPHGGTTRG